MWRKNWNSFRKTCRCCSLLPLKASWFLQVPSCCITIWQKSWMLSRRCWSRNRKSNRRCPLNIKKRWRRGWGLSGTAWKKWRKAFCPSKSRTRLNSGLMRKRHRKPFSRTGTCRSTWMKKPWASCTTHWLCSCYWIVLTCFLRESLNLWIRKQ